MDVLGNDCQVDQGTVENNARSDIPTNHEDVEQEDVVVVVESQKDVQDPYEFEERTAVSRKKQIKELQEAMVSRIRTRIGEISRNAY